MSSPTYLESLRYLLKICYLSHGVEHLASIQVLFVSPTHFRRDVVNISPIPIKMVASELLYINKKDVIPFIVYKFYIKIGLRWLTFSWNEWNSENWFLERFINLISVALKKMAVFCIFHNSSRSHYSSCMEITNKKFYFYTGQMMK